MRTASRHLKTGTLASRSQRPGKKINGRKRHLLTDTLGLLPAVMVTRASTTDRDAARILLPAARSRLPRLSRVWADGGYRGHLQDWAAQHLGLVVDVVLRSDDDNGFQALPRRWVVERSFAWFLRSRRLVRDYERRTDTSEAVILWSMTVLMSRCLAAHHPRPVPARPRIDVQPGRVDEVQPGAFHAVPGLSPHLLTRCGLLDERVAVIPEHVVHGGRGCDDGRTADQPDRSQSHVPRHPVHRVASCQARRRASWIWVDSATIAAHASICLSQDQCMRSARLVSSEPARTPTSAAATPPTVITVVAQSKDIRSPTAAVASERFLPHDVPLVCARCAARGANWPRISVA